MYTYVNNQQLGPYFAFTLLSIMYKLVASLVVVTRALINIVTPR